jgi:hypothetical protein
MNNESNQNQCIKQPEFTQNLILQEMNMSNYEQPQHAKKIKSYRLKCITI